MIYLFYISGYENLSKNRDIKEDTILKNMYFESFYDNKDFNKTEKNIKKEELEKDLNENLLELIILTINISPDDYVEEIEKYLKIMEGKYIVKSEDSIRLIMRLKGIEKYYKKLFPKLSFYEKYFYVGEISGKSENSINDLKDLLSKILIFRDRVEINHLIKSKLDEKNTKEYFEEKNVEKRYNLVRKIFGAENLLDVFDHLLNLIEENKKYLDMVEEGGYNSLKEYINMIKELNNITIEKVEYNPEKHIDIENYFLKGIGEGNNYIYINEEEKEIKFKYHGDETRIDKKNIYECIKNVKDKKGKIKNKDFERGINIFLMDLYKLKELIEK